MIHLTNQSLLQPHYQLLTIQGIHSLATDVSETHEELLVPNGSTIPPRSHSFNKLKTHLKVQTSIKELERNKTSGKDYTVIIEMCTINLLSLHNMVMSLYVTCMSSIDQSYRK